MARPPHSPRARATSRSASSAPHDPIRVLPTDGDLFRTVTRGVRWTAMPTWHELPDKERLAVVTYQDVLEALKDEKPEPALRSASAQGHAGAHRPGKEPT
jgi:hypothetical protein